ncbi:uncharacterized protein HKW66_Vig0245330 [Vigna angularis]|uniref:Uncharacterized protein n=1 Tax=Phaseolus angularis TaxID=3914 RepID=A0A8T0KYS5_PHAAN|nr:uncharacterized protein HKW66_Vig0245330 [Vigna angularis]
MLRYKAGLENSCATAEVSRLKFEGYGGITHSQHRRVTVVSFHHRDVVRTPAWSELNPRPPSRVASKEESSRNSYRPEIYNLERIEALVDVLNVGSQVASTGFVVVERRRKWWWLCRDGDAKPTSLNEFLEVEWQCDDNAFYGAAAEIEGMMMDSPRNHDWALFFDRRVLPPSCILKL